jgi:hypothetical protein
MRLEKLLEVFTKPEEHRLLYRFFNRDELHRPASKEHEEAYFWLLDKAESWTDDRAEERLGALKETRTRMLDHSRAMLRDGYRLIECMYPRANNMWANLFRGPSYDFYRYLERDHGLSEKEIAARREFYAGHVDASYTALKQANKLPRLAARTLRPE